MFSTLAIIFKKIRHQYIISAIHYISIIYPHQIQAKTNFKLKYFEVKTPKVICSSQCIELSAVQYIIAYFLTSPKIFWESILIHHRTYVSRLTGKQLSMEQTAYSTTYGDIPHSSAFIILKIINRLIYNQFSQ